MEWQDCASREGIRWVPYVGVAPRLSQGTSLFQEASCLAPPAIRQEPTSRPTGNVPGSDEAPAVTAGASGLFQSAPAIPTLTATPSPLPAIPRPPADGSPVERPRRFLNTLG